MTLLPLHIVAAVLAVVSGVLAMYAAKGGTLHRQSAMVFVVGMLVTASAEATMAA
jgi:uncharacterized membrane protein